MCLLVQRQFDVTKEDLRSLNPSAAANLLWGLAKTGAAFADGFDRECLEAVAADMGPKLLSFSPRVRADDFVLFFCLYRHINYCYFF